MLTGHQGMYHYTHDRVGDAVDDNLTEEVCKQPPTPQIGRPALFMHMIFHMILINASINHETQKVLGQTHRKKVGAGRLFTAISLDFRCKIGLNGW